MAKIRLLFDTNVLVYAHDELSPFHESSAALLDLAIERKVAAVLAEQNIIELYRIVTSSVATRGRPLTSAEAKGLIEETYLSGAFRILYPTKAVLEKTLQLAVETGAAAARIFDLRLAAHALIAGIPMVATHNTSHFSGLETLVAELPGEIVARVGAHEK
jgi:predicted nucleic acid-binding protein